MDLDDAVQKFIIRLVRQSPDLPYRANVYAARLRYQEPRLMFVCYGRDEATVRYLAERYCDLAVEGVPTPPQPTRYTYVPRTRDRRPC